MPPKFRRDPAGASQQFEQVMLYVMNLKHSQ